MKYQKTKYCHKKMSLKKLGVALADFFKILNLPSQKTLICFRADFFLFYLMSLNGNPPTPKREGGFSKIFVFKISLIHAILMSKTLSFFVVGWLDMWCLTIRYIFLLEWLVSLLGYLIDFKIKLNLIGIENVINPYKLTKFIWYRAIF